MKIMTMKSIRQFLATFGAIALVASLLVSASATVAAQDATPVPECVAPELPPGTPTPFDEASPVADDAAPAAIEDEATPADDMAGHDMGTERQETAADEATAAAAREGLQNVLDCIAAGDYLGAAALMTSDFVLWVTETGNPYDVPLTLEGIMPMRIVEEVDVVSDADGRVGVHLIYGDFFNSPGVLSSERWYLVEEDGVWKVDEIANQPVPEGFLPEATIVDVQMVDFAFAPSMNEISSGPVIFRFTNTSYTHAPHVGVIVTLVEGVTAEQVIQMDELPDDQLTGFFGAAFVEPGQTADLIFEQIDAGTYTMVCDVTTPDGVPHWQLGMVTQFDVS
jgi:uncharacterized cupredoxin-like copper-binding protein